MRASQRRLEHVIAALGDDDVGQPSLLPGWTVGHVLTHLARNAEGMTRITDSAGRDDVGVMYPPGDYADGAARRNADIEAGSARPIDELRADLVEAAQRLDESVSRLTDRQLDGYGFVGRSRRPVADIPLLRRREIEVHLVDLGRGYRFADWPDDFVRQELRVLGMQWDSRRGMGMTGLPEQALAAPPSHRLAWLFGRATIEGLDPADVYNV